MPFIDLGQVVVAHAAAHGHVEAFDARAGRSEHGIAQVAAQGGEFGLVLALVRQQDQVGGLHGGLGLAREVVGVARADADQAQRHGRQGRAHGAGFPRGTSITVSLTVSLKVSLAVSSVAPACTSVAGKRGSVPSGR